MQRRHSTRNSALAKMLNGSGPCIPIAKDSAINRRFEKSLDSSSMPIFAS